MFVVDRPITVNGRRFLPPFFNICSFAESFGGFEPLSYRDASSPLCQLIDTKKGIKWVIYPERAQGVTVTESSFVIPLPPRKLDPLADSLAAQHVLVVLPRLPRRLGILLLLLPCPLLRLMIPRAMHSSLRGYDLTISSSFRPLFRRCLVLLRPRTQATLPPPLLPSQVSVGPHGFLTPVLHTI